MIHTKYYDNLEQRSLIVTRCNGDKLTMLHDDFDPDWEPGDEPHGTMTFTDEPTSVASIEPGRDIFAEIDALKAKVEKLKITLEKK